VASEDRFTPSMAYKARALKWMPQIRVTHCKLDKRPLISVGAVRAATCACGPQLVEEPMLKNLAVGRRPPLASRRIVNCVW
jgi:hypothetical protein